MREHSPTLAVLPELYAAVCAALAGDTTALSGFGSRLPPRANGDGIAEIHVTGIVTPNTVLAKMLGGTSTTDVREEFDRALADPGVHAISMRYNTPGGFVEGVHELASHIHAARGKKPIIAHVEGMAASAGFWLASSADRVYTSSSLAEVGSVGVRATHVDRSKALDGAGIKLTEVTSGKFKNAASPNAPLDDTGRGELQRRVDAIHAEFAGHVAKARGLPPAESEKVSNGRLFWGAEAQRLRLIDGVKSYPEVLAELASKHAPKPAPIAKAPSLVAGLGDVALRARLFMNEQAKLGKYVTAADAVAHVSNLT